MGSVARNSIPSSTHCLQRVDGLPIDFEEALLAHYPAMKLGVVASVDFYIDKLATLSKQVMFDNADCKNWAITAPPFITAPAAANLLCWKLYSNLQKSLSGKYNLSLVDLHYTSDPSGIKGERDFKLGYEYSSNSVEERVKERSRLKDNINSHEKEFFDKGVLIVNDIRVTGTQQEFMHQSFQKVSPARLHWLYILEVDKQLGAKHPQIENQINSSSLQSLDEYQQVLSSDETRYTARCISRLFTHNQNQFRSLLTELNSDKQKLILKYAIGEKRFNGHYFDEKMSILQAMCESGEREMPGEKATTV